MVNLWSGLQPLLPTIRKMSAFYIHITAVTQLPVLLPVLLVMLLPMLLPAAACCYLLVPAVACWCLLENRQQ